MTQEENVDVADIFRKYGHAYRVSHKMPLNHIRTMHAIERCRTSELGGHIDCVVSAKFGPYMISLES